MYVAVLGPLEVEHEDRPIQVAGARLRRLLTRLAVDAGRAVSTAELVDAVWPDDPPVETADSLQSLVSRLRRALGGPDVIAQVAPGYLLHVPASMTNIHGFSELVRTGQRQLSADPTSAEVDLDQALDLWRGAPLADADGAAYSIPIVARLEEQRLGALADRAEASIGLGRVAEPIIELEQLAAAFQ